MNAVAPGFVETELTAALSEEQRTFYTNVIPAGRIAKPEEVAKEKEASVARAKEAREREALERFFDEHKDEVASVIAERKVYAFIKANARIKDA